MIRCYSISKTVWASRIFGYIASNCTSPLTGRIRSIVKTKWSNVRGKVQVHHTRLHNCIAICFINFKNIRHSRHSNYNTAVLCNRTSAKTSSRSSCYNRKRISPTHFYYRSYFSRGLRQYNDNWIPTIDRTIIFIN